MQLNNIRQKENAKGTTSKGGSGAGGHSKGAAKREEILVGLMKALANGKLRNPPLRAIGQALGIEPAHILYYFGSREELLKAVITRWDDDERARRPGAKTALPALPLDEYVATIARNMSRPGIVHLYLTLAAEAAIPDHPTHEFFRQRFETVRRNVADGIREEQAAGTMSRDLDPEHQARLLIALADGMQLQSLVDRGVNAAGDLASAIAHLRGRK